MFGYGASQAAVISVVPSSPVIGVGGQTTVDIIVSDLGDGAAPSVSVFDINFEFDSTLLGFSGVTFGDQLALTGVGSLQIFDDSVAGVVNLLELSFDFPLDIDDLQLPEFTLATLTLEGLKTGVSPLTLSVLGFGDSFGDPLQFSVAESSLQVVPVPGALPLMLTALAGLSFFSRRRKTQSAT